MASTQSEAMARAQALMKQKSDIEAEIKQAQDDLQSALDSNISRKWIATLLELRNDLKTTMDQIEKALHEVHAEALAEKKKQQEQEAEERKRQGGTNGTDSSSSTTSSTAQGRGNQLLPPFARVNSVAPDSPAREAGLLVDDRIVSFGIINANTPNVLPSLGAHVQSRENQPIVVKVQRVKSTGSGEETDTHSLVLVPRQGWGGRGLLGCHILPL